MSSHPSERGMQAGSALPAPGPAALGLAIAGSDETIRFANQEFVALTGASPREVVGKELAFFYGEQADAACLAQLHDALAARHEFSSAVQGVRPNGERFMAELGVVPVFDNQGELLHFVAILRDMSNVEQAAAALDFTGERFHELLEHLPAGVVVHGRDTKIRAVNALAAQLLGVRAEQLVGTGAYDGNWKLLADEGRPMQRRDFPVCRTLESKTNLSNLVVGVDRGKDLGVVWLLCNTFLICDEGGELREVVVCFTDCTELKHTEQSLQKSEERLRLVLQGSNDAPWDWDLRTNELYYSPRWWEMLGRTEGELPVDSELWLRLMHPADVTRVREAFRRALAGRGQAYEVEGRMQHKDGHYVPILARGFILRDEQGVAVRMSGTNTDLTERKEAERRIHQLAYFDYLTGLPNRRFLMDQLHKLMNRYTRSGEVGALLFIDLDNFKVLNDTLGHDVGDLLLRQVAQRLRHAVRESDDVARLGGDEFVVVLDNLGADPALAAREADLVANKVLATCRETYDLSSRVYRSTPSIGIAMFDQRTESVDVLLRQADLAMYQAKAAGRNTLRFFDPMMQAAIDRRYALEHDLREGLLRKEFRLYCQPQFGPHGTVFSGEVLLRWQHPERGLVSPAEFIGMAEATGLVVQVGHWVLRETCRRLAAWARHPVLHTLSLAVNVSARQMRAADFADQVLAIVAETGANPHRLSLELTESLLAENIEDVIGKMNSLRRAGLSFSLDDFGTGYSSLSYLKRFPLETLKIDQSFVRDIRTDPNAAAIVEVIITLARKLGLKVIAEGVEDEGQRQFLQRGGCNGFQGYLLGQPIAIDEFERRYGCA